MLLLNDECFLDDLISKLKITFEKDESFESRLFNRQMAVLKGQAFNLADALKKGPSPANHHAALDNRAQR